MKFTKVSQHPHELLPKNKKRCEKKKIHATVRLFFHIFPLSETSPFKKTNKKAGAPRFAVRNDLQDDSWSFRCDTQSWSQVPIRDLPKMWGDGMGITRG